MYFKFLFILFFNQFFSISSGKNIEYARKGKYVKNVIILSYNMNSLIEEVIRLFGPYEARSIEKIINKYLPKNWHDPKAKAEVYYINTQKSKIIQYILFSGSGKKIEIIFKDFEKSVIVEDSSTLMKIEIDPKYDIEIYKLPKKLVLNIEKFLIKLEKKNYELKKYRKYSVYYSANDFSVVAIVFENYKGLKDYCIFCGNMIVNQKGIEINKTRCIQEFGLKIKKIITSKFGQRYHPLWGGRNFHSGIDLKVKKGTPVYAAYTGKIIYCGWVRGYGYCVKIAHSKQVMSVYAHLSKFAPNIKKGANIKKGRLIAYSGSTGFSTAPHLHFEIRINNKPVDPLKFKFFYHRRISTKKKPVLYKILSEIEEIDKDF